MPILTPRDQIVIDIDNTKTTNNVTFRCSRDLPWPYVASIMANVVAQLLGFGLSTLPPAMQKPAMLEGPEGKTS